MEYYYNTPESGIKVKYKGAINFPRFYKHLRLWLEENGFAKEETLEKRYVERIKPNGKQLEITWETEKEASDYFTYHIQVGFIILGLNDVEVQEGNLKRKLQSATYEIKITAYITYGGDKWESLGPLLKIYKNYISKKRLEEHYQLFYEKIYSFQEEIKNYLNLRT